MTSREMFESFMRDKHPSLNLARASATDGGYVNMLTAAFWQVWQVSRREAFDDVKHCAQVQGQDTYREAQATIAAVEAMEYNKGVHK